MFVKGTLKYDCMTYYILNSVQAQGFQFLIRKGRDLKTKL